MMATGFSKTPLLKAPLALFRALFLSHPKAMALDLRGKTIVVTGATPGSIGFESARTFLAWGARVCVTVRSEKNVESCRQQLLQETDTSLQAKLAVQQMDLQDSGSVTSFTSWCLDNLSQVDVLLNNAGVYLDMLGEWKQEQLSPDGFEVHWRVNYLGNLQVSCELLPLLMQAAKQQGEARVIMVSSHMHDNCHNEEMFEGLQPYRTVKAYGRSKLALNHLALYLHEKLYGKHGLKFVCVHPGSIYTNLVNKGLEGKPVLLVLREKLRWIEKAILLSPEEGAQTQIMCATCADVESGAYYYRCAKAGFAASLQDKAATEKLWLQSRDWLQQIDVRLPEYL